MQSYEYKVLPAPNRAKRVKGVKGNAARFAALLTETMNDLAKDGWQYVRSDSMPVEEKPGLLKSRVENYHTVLVFRRPVVAEEETPMAGYIEDQTDQPLPAELEEASAPVEDVAEVEPPAPEHHWPEEPPLTSPSAEVTETAQPISEEVVSEETGDSPFAPQSEEHTNR